jgi:hypothetical protein
MIRPQHAHRPAPAFAHPQVLVHTLSTIKRAVPLAVRSPLEVHMMMLYQVEYSADGEGLNWAFRQLAKYVGLFGITQQQTNPHARPG